MKWSILDTKSENGVITSAKYFASLEDESFKVETEGVWTFQNPIARVPFEQVTEDMVADWIQKEAVIDGKCHIIANLESQLEDLKNDKSNPAPWMMQVFTPGI